MKHPEGTHGHRPIRPLGTYYIVGEGKPQICTVMKVNVVRKLARVRTGARTRVVPVDWLSRQRQHFDRGRSRWRENVPATIAGWFGVV